MASPSAYLTVTDLLTAPLGLSLKTVPGPTSSGQQSWAELQNVVWRASALVDSHCQQILGATLDSEEKRTDQMRAGVDANGYLWVHTDYWPVIAVESFQYGYPAIGGTEWIVPALADLLINRERITYPGWFDRRGLPLRVQYTYLNGFPNTTLASAVTTGATALPVADATGMVAGTRLTVSDGGSTEEVTVASGWTPTQGAASVTLASGTLFAHTPVAPQSVSGAQWPVAIAVTALPADIKQATLLIVKNLLEVRGANALVMGRTGGVRGSTSQDTATAEKIPVAAADVLDKYRRII